MSQDVPIRVIDVPSSHEFRFELEPTETIAITLVSGTAEIFGFELVTGGTYRFSDEVRAAVYSHDGATLQMRNLAGKCETSYVATETPLPAYLSLHLALSRKRLLAKPSTVTEDFSLPDDAIPPPRIMVAGERGAGKTSLIKTLLNWRVRELSAKGQGSGDAGLLFVNLDVGEGGLTMPGTLSITRMNALIPTTTTTCVLGTSASSGPPVPYPPTSTLDVKSDDLLSTYAPPLSPLVFWHGHTSPNVNAKLYEALLKSVGREIKRKEETSSLEAWKAGIIVDTPGEWAEKKGMAVVAKAVRELEINTLLVVGSERLNVEMQKLMSTNKGVNVVRVPKSDGASEPDLTYQSRVKDAQIRSYFYGGPPLTQGVLSPFSIIVRFDDLKVFRVGESAEVQAPSSALPIGFARTTSDTELVPLDLTLPHSRSEVLNRILAIPQAKDDADEEAIGQGGVLGFVYVSALDQAKKKITLLSPLPGRLPRRTLLVASLDWQDA